MPRSGPGPATGAFHILTLPALGASNPPISRNKVDLPHPEAPIRQMNSPSSIVSEAPLSARIWPAPDWKVLDTPAISRMGSPSGMLRTPAQQSPPQPLHELVGQVTGNADDHHASDDDLGAGELPRLDNDGAEPCLHTGHLANHDHHPRKPQAQAKAGKDTGQRRWQSHLGEDCGAGGPQHAGRLEQTWVDAANTENRVDQDWIESAKKHQEEGAARPDAE